MVLVIQGCSASKGSNPVPLPDLYFDSFSYPVASIVFGDMAIVSLFLLLFFFSQSQILSGKVQVCSQKVHSGSFCITF